MTRRTLAAALALAVSGALAAVAGPALAGEDPPCATGAFTSYHVQEVSYAGVYAPRVFLRLEGWAGPCANGAPLPAGFRRSSYYADGVIVHNTPDPDPFTSSTGPTTFGEYFGVDTARLDGGPLVAVCIAYHDTQFVDCIRLEPRGDGGPPGIVPVPTSYVPDHVKSWPPNQIAWLHPDPTCGTCV